MRYLLMICSDESTAPALSPEEQVALDADWDAFTAEMQRRGVIQSAARLRPTTDATTVQVRDRRVLTTDGPFAETKEQVGGFFLIEAGDLDEAIEIASRIPAARLGTIEIRPLWE